MKRNKYEKIFFDRLAEKLEELFPKTNIDNPEILSANPRRQNLDHYCNQLLLRTKICGNL